MSRYESMLSWGHLSQVPHSVRNGSAELLFFSMACANPSFQRFRSTSGGIGSFGVIMKIAWSGNSPSAYGESPLSLPQSAGEG